MAFDTDEALAQWLSSGQPPFGRRRGVSSVCGQHGARQSDRENRTTMRPHVLIIDDDASLREALTVVLEEEFAVYTATTGEEGLALLQRLPIPVVILDLGLPGMPGLEVLTHIKALDPQIEVLILTATHEGAVVVHAMQAGASDYLTKPFDGEALQTRVRTAFAQYCAVTHGTQRMLEMKEVQGLLQELGGQGASRGHSQGDRRSDSSESTPTS